MAKKVKLENLGDAITEELTTYHTDVLERVNKLGRQSIDKLVKITRSTAPVGKRGSFRKNITSEERKDKRGNAYIWGVKAPDHRLTHLLVHGHETKDGGRTKGDPFLENALEQVLSDYEEGVKEALKS